MAGRRLKAKVLVDSRENKPYTFPRTTRKRLETGDYSLEGMAAQVAFERKARADLIDCLYGKDKSRFKSQLYRLSEVPHSAVVAEVSWRTLGNGSWSIPFLPDIGGRELQEKVINLTLETGVQIYFAGSREAGQKLMTDLLRRACHICLSESEEEVCEGKEPVAQ